MDNGAKKYRQANQCTNAMWALPYDLYNLLVSIIALMVPQVYTGDDTGALAVVMSSFLLSLGVE
jgi:hypothetical protein